MQSSHKILVTFAAHVGQDELQSMVSALMACGDVASKADQRSFVVKTRRDSSFTYLCETLTGWERYGFCRWEQTS